MEQSFLFSLKESELNSHEVLGSWKLPKISDPVPILVLDGPLFYPGKLRPKERGL
jgi:hypothetical protein